jgi:hypothetical protein
MFEPQMAEDMSNESRLLSGKRRNDTQLTVNRSLCDHIVVGTEKESHFEWNWVRKAVNFL